jgi:hypothetical protein
MRSIYVLPLILLACGDNGSVATPPDAAPRADAAPDSQVIECDYTEAADATNDNFFGSGTEEPTGLAFGTGPIAICGKFESSHYDTGMMAVDVDSYKLAVPADSNAILYVTAPGAENFNTVLVEIYGMTTSTDEVGQFKSGFATAATKLPAGNYIINLSAFDDAAATADVSYKVVIQIDSPTRCPTFTGATSFTEASDTASASGNDVYEVRYSTTPRRKLTDNVADAPEDTMLTINPTDTKLIKGINSDPTIDPLDWMDFYQDRDTYKITTGATTNQLSLRLNWAGTTADFDFLVFEEGSLVDFADGYDNVSMEDEFATFAVDPNQVYWIFVGADDTTTGQPIDYDLTVCGGTFTP